MNAIPFDTLKMARKLEAAGFPGPQAAGAAEAMAEAMSGAELATKADLTHEIVTLRADLERDITAMETRLSTAITKVGNDVDFLRRDMTIRLGAIVIASTGIVLGAMRYMLMHA